MKINIKLIVHSSIYIIVLHTCVRAHANRHAQRRGGAGRMGCEPSGLSLAQTEPLSSSGTVHHRQLSINTQPLRTSHPPLRLGGRVLSDCAKRNVGVWPCGWALDLFKAGPEREKFSFCVLEVMNLPRVPESMPPDSENQVWPLMERPGLSQILPVLLLWTSPRPDSRKAASSYR